MLFRSGSPSISVFIIWLSSDTVILFWLIISQDIPFYSDWGKNSFKKFEAIRSFDNITGFTHIFESVLPKLKARGVSEDEIHTLLVKNPARVFHGGYTY